MAKAIELGAPMLRVKDLNKTLAFYNIDFGLQVNRRYRDSDNLEVVELGSSSKASILHLKHDPNATLAPPNSAGLYHYAVLVPDRKSLASTFLAIGNAGVLYEGFADHLVSEALYLHDVEQNGIEVYSDRPRNVWPNWKEISEKAQKTCDYGTVMSVM
jgi:catechol 2,3-dioxygenase